MSKLLWRSGSVAELSQLLTQGTLETSTEISGSTVYHLTHDGQDKVAISLPDGKALFIESTGGRKPRRRRAESVPAVEPTQTS
ncbi:hypothetical protein [Rhodoferax sp. UBA5149]|uniref:hypothetical protein n=1 Tax=Rhodoferax sp. UBA5149 TaxID=1947379 RepID=UPI0025DA79F6|nr:hypothetical protein [Rhodoferax sp. UBA5149]